MTLEMFAVYDEKVKAFGVPIFVAHEGVAVRSFTSTVWDQTTDFYKFAEDYTLFHVGSYDPDTGRCEALVAPRMVLSALAVRSVAKESQS